MPDPVHPALDAVRLRELLDDTEFAGRLIVTREVDSTNDEVRRLAGAGAPPLTTVVADGQSAGRGRLGRGWHSPRGLGLYVSTLFRPQRPIDEVARWTLAAAVAACQACRELAGPEIIIKWPNDLIHAGRKLGGTLAEVRSVPRGSAELVVGTGLNVQHRPADFPAEIAAQATSLRIACGAVKLERERLAALYLRRLGRLGVRLAEGDWAAVAEEWARLAPGACGMPVCVRSGDQSTWEGVTRGLDPIGALIVERPDGSRIALHLGESVVPLET